MKNILKFIFFISYLLAIFWVSHFGILVFLLVFNILWIQIFDKDLNKLLKRLKIILPFVLFTGLLNALLVDWMMRWIDCN